MKPAKRHDGFTRLVTLLLTGALLTSEVRVYGRGFGEVISTPAPCGVFIAEALSILSPFGGRSIDRPSTGRTMSEFLRSLYWGGTGLSAFAPTNMGPSAPPLYSVSRLRKILDRYLADPDAFWAGPHCRTFISLPVQTAYLLAGTPGMKLKNPARFESFIAELQELADNPPTHQIPINRAESNEPAAPPSPLAPLTDTGPRRGRPRGPGATPVRREIHVETGPFEDLGKGLQVLWKGIAGRQVPAEIVSVRPRDSALMITIADLSERKNPRYQYLVPEAGLLKQWIEGMTDEQAFRIFENCFHPDASRAAQGLPGARRSKVPQLNPTPDSEVRREVATALLQLLREFPRALTQRDLTAIFYPDWGWDILAGHLDYLASQQRIRREVIGYGLQYQRLESDALPAAKRRNPQEVILALLERNPLAKLSKPEIIAAGAFASPPKQLLKWLQSLVAEGKLSTSKPFDHNVHRFQWKAADSPPGQAPAPRSLRTDA